MNPAAIVLALLATAGTVGALGRGRPRRVLAEDETAERGPVAEVDDRDSGGDPSDDPREPVQGSNPPQSPEPVIPTPIFPPNPPVQTGGEGSDGGSVAPTPITGQTVSAYSGRMMTLSPDADDIASVRIVSQPQHGHVSVNPDNTLAVVLTQTTATGPMSFTYEVTHSDGSSSLHSAPLDVVAGPQAGGWGTSESHYMLATDENDRVVVEHGDNHRKVFVSNSETALSRADIAAIEGVSVDAITGRWLAARPHYGATEDMALAPDAGMSLWSAINPRGGENSNWLLFERGYTYGSEVGSMGRLIERGASGESELHPIYVGAWGEGDQPILTERQMAFQNVSKNVVIQDLHFAGGFRLMDMQNIIIDNATFTNSGVTVEINSSGITIRNSAFYDIHRNNPVNDGDTWAAHPNRTSGLYVASTKGVLLEGNFFDLIAWEEDYRLDGSVEGGQPPSMFSHNMYLQYGLDDVTLRDTISMRAASFGVQVRSGGFIEDNVFLDNNAGFSFLGGTFGNRDPLDNYSLVADNLVISAAFKRAPMIGALDWGFVDGGYLSSIVDNIVAHAADPNNPEEMAARANASSATQYSQQPFYDDTIVWNWGRSADQNVEGLDPAILNQTTIQLFTAQLLGRPNATIEDLAGVLRAQASGALDNMVDADLIIRFFQSGFGIAPDVRVEPGLLRFIPNELGDGVRWDNRLNWSTQDLPGFAGVDSVDLGGNKVVFGGTATVDELEFGPNGGLTVVHGKLTVAGGMETGAEGATLDIGKAGQVWTDGGRGEGTLDIDVTGGRFANTGDFRMNSDLTASGGQTLLGVDNATFAVTNGSRLEILGGDGKVGFDGEANGISILGVGQEGTLAFTARDGKLGSIEEFRSGALGDETRVWSGVDLGNGRLEIDLSDLVDGAGVFTLLDVDELIGGFGSANVTGLGSRDAELIIDYETDAVSLKLSAGSGAVNISTVGTESTIDAGAEALWAALTAGRGSYDEAVPAVDDEDYLFAA